MKRRFSIFSVVLSLPLRLGSKREQIITRPTIDLGTQLVLVICVAKRSGCLGPSLAGRRILYTRIYTLPKSQYHRLAAVVSNLAVLSHLSCRAIPLCRSSGAVQRAVVKSPGVSCLVRSIPTRWSTGAG